MSTLKPITNSIALDLLRWRNQPHVRETMISQEIIDEKQHLEWWSKAAVDGSKRFFVLERSGIAVAVINYFDIDKSAGTGWWGFYLTDAVKPGDKALIEIWSMVETVALSYAFDHLKLDRLLCETRDSNHGVLLLHDRVGFETLAADEFPNAVEHNLIVKQFTRETAQNSCDAWAKDLAKVTITPDERDVDWSMIDRFVVLTSSNWDGLARDIETYASPHTGRKMQVSVPPFGQYKFDLFDENSDLRKGVFDGIIFAERFEDLIGPLETVSSDNLEMAVEKFQEYVGLIEMARENLSGRIFINAITMTRPRTLANDRKWDAEDLVSKKLGEMNVHLAELADKLADVHILPVNHLVDKLGAAACDPGKYWLMGRFPFGTTFGKAYGEMLAGTLMSLSGATARCLVLDLDNTLWGGVIGDDGMEGIQLNDDFPGNQFKAMQKFIASTVKQGLILAVCSKNTEIVAMEAIEEHPHMVLRKDDLAAWQINWEPKSQNIAVIAQQLDLGVGSLMFIDDNPMERNEVRQNCPGVIVPEMPLDVTTWPAFLADYPALAATTVLASDADKAKKYRIRSQIAAAQTQSVSKEDFLRKLEMGIEVQPVESINRNRALQLIAKTNQFNTTSIRYSEAELEQMESGGGEMLTVRITDKYGSDEVIGVVVTRIDDNDVVIDNYIMSCRVLGRGVEAATLAIVSERAIAKGAASVHARVVETERNHPCRTVFADNGFEEIEPLAYAIELKDGPLERPNWFTYL